MRGTYRRGLTHEGELGDKLGLVRDYLTFLARRIVWYVVKRLLCAIGVESVLGLWDEEW